MVEGPLNRVLDHASGPGAEHIFLIEQLLLISF